jgi:hypothetical protein
MELTEWIKDRTFQERLLQAVPGLQIIQPMDRLGYIFRLGEREEFVSHWGIIQDIDTSIEENVLKATARALKKLLETKITVVEPLLIEERLRIECKEKWETT